MLVEPDGSFDTVHAVDAKVRYGIGLSGLFFVLRRADGGLVLGRQLCRLWPLGTSLVERDRGAVGSCVVASMDPGGAADPWCGGTKAEGSPPSHTIVYPFGV